MKQHSIFFIYRDGSGRHTSWVSLLLIQRKKRTAIELFGAAIITGVSIIRGRRADGFPHQEKVFAERFAIERDGSLIKRVCSRVLSLPSVEACQSQKCIHKTQAVGRVLILLKLKLMEQSLRRDFGINKPRIAVLGLNPHAGDGGLIGTEDEQIIRAVVSEQRNKGRLIFGPMPADGFFGMAQYRQYDAVLAMYHDQGLIPFKALAFETGVNFTGGLSVIRTSPDHGTGYTIAGKNQANESSMREAIFLAGEIFRQHAEQSKEK